jgi:hypothetical protein
MANGLFDQALRFEFHLLVQMLRFLRASKKGFEGRRLRGVIGLEQSGTLLLRVQWNLSENDL